jgi:hypothetical protein
MLRVCGVPLKVRFNVRSTVCLLDFFLVGFMFFDKELFQIVVVGVL